MGFNDRSEFFLSSATLLEIWFVLREKGFSNFFSRVLAGLKAMGVRLCRAGLVDFDAAASLSVEYGLSPADSVHAALATGFDAIVSSDSCFDRVPGLKRIDFTKTRKIK